MCLGLCQCQLHTAYEMRKGSVLRLHSRHTQTYSGFKLTFFLLYQSPYAHIWCGCVPLAVAQAEVNNQSPCLSLNKVVMVFIIINVDHHQEDEVNDTL